MAMSPFRLHMLASDLHQRRRLNGETLAVETVEPESRVANGPALTQPTDQTSSNARTSTRPTKQRATSYYNVFQTSCSVSSDTPPSYAVAARARPVVARSLTEGSETLPRYSCSVEISCKVLSNLESVNPLSPVGSGDWKEVYLVLRGTSLSFHRVKDGHAGKLLRSYTLQHAEVGLATDSQHTVLLPQSRLASLIPSGARRRAWQRDPELFKPIRQTLLRLRVETDQLLIADSDEELVHSLIHSLCAAIDISTSLDERSIPRQCTVPRRRRRPRQQFNGDLTDPALLAEQERIMRQMYPGLTGVVEDQAPAGMQSVVKQQHSTVIAPADAPATPAREEEEIDFSMIREEMGANSTARSEASDVTLQPGTIRQTTSTTIHSTFSDDMMYATAPTNFDDDDGKWRPPHHRSAAQVQRYIRRCLPILHAEAPRASDIIIVNGKRMKINWRMELLEDWELQPPSYKAHNFDQVEGLVRANSQRSASESASPVAPQSSSSMLASEDDGIHPVEQGLEHLNLSKVMSASTVGKDSPMSVHGQPNGQETPGVVFCF